MLVSVLFPGAINRHGMILCKNSERTFVTGEYWTGSTCQGSDKIASTSTKHLSGLIFGYFAANLLLIVGYFLPIYQGSNKYPACPTFLHLINILWISGVFRGPADAHQLCFGGLSLALLR